MVNKAKLIFFTQNEGPFRMRWMDEIAKDISVEVYHIGEYQTGTNMDYISYHTIRAVTKNICKLCFGRKLFDYSKVNINKRDIVLLDGYGFLAQQLLILKLILKHQKFGITIDGGFIPSNELKIKYLLKKFILSHASFIFSTSKETDDFIIHYRGNKGNIYRHYFSNTVNLDLVKEVMKRKDKIKLRNLITKEDGWTFSSHFTLLSVGRLVPDKGFDFLIKAVDFINKKRQGDDKINVIIVGAREENNEYKLEDYNFIKILPFCDKEKLNKYYDASDVFILPTKHDVWGLVIGEAMARAMPIITTDKCLAGLAMVEPGKNGYIVPVGDISSLIKAIEKIEGDNLEKMGNESINIMHTYCIEESAKHDLLILKNQIRDKIYGKD